MTIDVCLVDFFGGNMVVDSHVGCCFEDCTDESVRGNGPKLIFESNVLRSHEEVV